MLGGITVFSILPLLGAAAGGGLAWAGYKALKQYRRRHSPGQR